MKLNAPTKLVWIISLILGILSVLSVLTDIPIVSDYSYWFMAIAWVLLILATALKGL